MILEDHTDFAAQKRHFGGLHVVEQLTIDVYIPFAGALHQHHQLEQGTFTGAAVAGQKGKFTMLQLERDVAQGILTF